MIVCGCEAIVNVPAIGGDMTLGDDDKTCQEQQEQPTHGLCVVVCRRISSFGHTTLDNIITRSHDHTITRSHEHKHLIVVLIRLLVLIVNVLCDGG